MNEASVTIAAPVERVWALVSDPTSMGRFSPGNTGGRWLGGSGPSVGARFVGFNKRGLMRWATTCKVTECEAPHRFAFQVDQNKMIWGWTLEPTEEGGTRLTQWRDRTTMPAKPVLMAAQLLFRGKVEEEMADGMSATLAAVKAEAESPGAPG